MQSVQNAERTPSVPESIYRALTHLMAELPYEKITITDICRRAGVSRMAYYRHYNNKQEILLQPLQKRLEEVYALWEAGELFTPELYWTAYFAALRRDDLIPLIRRAHLAHNMDQHILDHARKMIVGVEGWDLSQEDQRLHFYLAFAGSSGLLSYAFGEDPSVPNETLAAFLVKKLHT